MGVCIMMNLLGFLINFVGAMYQLVGIYDWEWVVIIVQVLG